MLSLIIYSIQHVTPRPSRLSIYPRSKRQGILTEGYGLLDLFIANILYESNEIFFVPLIHHKIWEGKIEVEE
jgi:hypothetical protein